MNKAEHIYAKSAMDELNRIQAVPISQEKLESVCYATKRIFDVLLKGESASEWAQGYLSDLRGIK